MHITVTGKNMELTEALKSRITEKLGHLQRFVHGLCEVHVVLSVEKERNTMEATMRLDGTVLNAEAVADDMYGALDILEDRLERQLLKYKEKHSHH
jgi:putative sigma-54 modulation protein